MRQISFDSILGRGQLLKSRREPTSRGLRELVGDSARFRGAMARMCEHALEKDGDVAPDGWVYPRVFRRKQFYT